MQIGSVILFRTC